MKVAKKVSIYYEKSLTAIIPGDQRVCRHIELTFRLYNVFRRA
jgi:hypothetical protein